MFQGLDYIRSLVAWNGRSHFDLSLMRNLVTALGSPQNIPKVIHVAGTNGKGSTSAAIAYALHKAGLSVGLNISPHLSHLNERISLNGNVVADSELNAAAIRLQDVCSSLNIVPSYHEALTALAFMILKDQEYLVLEVGLGGRLDASNVVDSPVASIITSIGLDHQNILGNTLGEIAAEKAGIIKYGCPVFIGRMEPESVNPILSYAKNVGASKIVCYDRDFTALADGLGAFTYKTKFEQFQLKPRVLGEHQFDNMGLATSVLRYLGISSSTIAEAMATFAWPGRLEPFQLANGRTGYLDGAHNIDGIRALTSFLDSHRIEQIELVFGAVNTKAWSNMLNILSKYAKKIHVIAPPSDLAVNPAAIIDCLSGSGISFQNWDSSYQKLIDHLSSTSMQNETPIIVAGSLYMVGEFRNRLFGPIKNLWS